MGQGAGRGGEMFPLRPEGRKSWNQWPGQQRAAGQEPRALVDAVPPAPLPACRRGREPRSPSTQRLGGCGSRPKVSPQGLGAARWSAGADVEEPAQPPPQSGRQPSQGSKGARAAHTHMPAHKHAARNRAQHSGLALATEMMQSPGCRAPVSQECSSIYEMCLPAPGAAGTMLDACWAQSDPCKPWRLQKALSPLSTSSRLTWASNWQLLTVSTN